MEAKNGHWVQHKSIRNWRRAVSHGENLQVHIFDELVSDFTFETNSSENQEPTPSWELETRRLGFRAVVNGTEHAFAASYAFKVPSNGGIADHRRRLNITIVDALGQVTPIAIHLDIENEAQLIDSQTLSELRAFRNRLPSKGFSLQPLHELPLAS